MQALPSAQLLGLRVRDRLNFEGTIVHTYLDDDPASTPCVRIQLDDGRLCERKVAAVEPIKPLPPKPKAPTALAGSRRDGSYPVRAPERAHVLNLHLEADTPDLLSAALEQIAMQLQDAFEGTPTPATAPRGDAHHHYSIDLRTNAPADAPFLERHAAWRTAREEFLREQGAG